MERAEGNLEEHRLICMSAAAFVTAGSDVIGTSQ
jgi:hypothetical protein